MSDSERARPAVLLYQISSESEKGWTVVNWSPFPDRGPETEEHLILHKESQAMVLRLKSRAAVNDLIQALERNRDLLWPKEQ